MTSWFFNQEVFIFCNLLTRIGKCVLITSCMGENSLTPGKESLMRFNSSVLLTMGLCLTFATCFTGCPDPVAPVDMGWLFQEDNVLYLDMDATDLDTDEDIYSVGYGYDGGWEQHWHKVGRSGGYTESSYDTGLWRINLQEEDGDWADIESKCDSADRHPFCYWNTTDGRWSLCFGSDGDDLYYASVWDCLDTEG